MGSSGPHGTLLRTNIEAAAVLVDIHHTEWVAQASITAMAQTLGLMELQFSLTLATHMGPRLILIWDPGPFEAMGPISGQADLGPGPFGPGPGPVQARAHLRVRARPGFQMDPGWGHIWPPGVSIPDNCGAEDSAN